MSNGDRRSSAGTGRVLVVDDSPTIRRVVANVLRQAGYDVVTAENGETGLVEARTALPDLIVLDFMMPGMNGYQFAKQLDADLPGRIPVVLLCTRTDQVPEGALKGLGVVDSITKPFSPDAILAVVTHCLEHKSGTTGQVTRLAELQRFDEEVTHPGLARAHLASSTDDDRERADRSLRDIAILLAEALASRGVDDAGALATSICADLRASLSATRLGDVTRVRTPSLSGDLASVGLPEVLQLLKFQGQTGVMEVSLEAASPTSSLGRFEVAVKNGLVVAVRARDVRSDLLLGNYFVGAGFVSRAQLDALLRAPAPAPTLPIGQRLVEAGLVTPEQLRRCVGAQAQDLMVELLRARSGTFGLHRGDDVLPATHINPGISVDMLLFESLRRIDEWSVIEKQVPSFEAVFVLDDPSLDAHDLSPDEVEVLAHFQAGRPMDVHELLRASSLRAFEACKILYRLCSLRRVRRVSDGSGRASDDEGPQLTSAERSFEAPG